MNDGSAASIRMRSRPRRRAHSLVVLVSLEWDALLGELPGAFRVSRPNESPSGLSKEVARRIRAFPRQQRIRCARRGRKRLFEAQRQGKRDRQAPEGVRHARVILRQEFERHLQERHDVRPRLRPLQRRIGRGKRVARRRVRCRGGRRCGGTGRRVRARGRRRGRRRRAPSPRRSGDAGAPGAAGSARRRACGG